MSTFLIRSATSPSSSYPIVLTRLGGPRSRPNPHFLKFVEVPVFEPATPWLVVRHHVLLIIQLCKKSLIKLDYLLYACSLCVLSKTLLYPCALFTRNTAEIVPWAPFHRVQSFCHVWNAPRNSFFVIVLAPPASVV